MASKDFLRLQDYLTRRMRMSHIYQPVMLRTLLESNGRSSVDAIAAAFLRYDQSQHEYYQVITDRMPGPVLRRHALVKKEHRDYVLQADVASMSRSEKQELLLLCD
jgi:ATP adenylyltransferase